MAGGVHRRVVVGGAIVAMVVALGAVPASARIVRATSVLPPGESGFVSLAGLASGSGSPRLYDQTPPFERFERKDAQLGQPATSVQSPRAGVTLRRDRFGVPSVTGRTSSDLWWGAGYATAQDRLFELELFARATSGHLAEVVGKSELATDIATRRDFYTPAQLDAIFARLPADIRQRYRDYLAGINAWVAHVRVDPLDLPGEYVALADPPRAFTIEDLLGIGVYLARTTPNGDGSELTNARALRASGPAKLNRILPLRLHRQVRTVSRTDGLFPSDPGRTRSDERAALRRSRRFVAHLPRPRPGNLGTEPPVPSALVASAAGAAAARRLPAPIRLGGSYAVAIRQPRAHRAFLFNGPELGFTAPEELYEIELHGPGLDVRGTTAPGAPVIAIGHNAHVAFGLTSGLSDTNALYAERLVPGHPEEYLPPRPGRRMSCRTETLRYRSEPTSILNLNPSSPPSAGQETFRLCRTVHGPVQEREGSIAYARRYATWRREADTIVGLARIDAARNLRQVSRATADLTWNENLIAADDRGSIGYWHPGLLPEQPRHWDERLPYPGDGRAEWRGVSLGAAPTALARAANDGARDGAGGRVAAADPVLRPRHVRGALPAAAMTARALAMPLATRSGHDS